MRVFSRYDTIRYDMRASKKTFFLRNFRRIFRIFGEFSEFSANFRRIFRIFGEFLEFSAKKDKKITGFENIEILYMGGSIRYTLRYTEKSDISALDNFLTRYAHPCLRPFLWATCPKISPALPPRFK